MFRIGDKAMCNICTFPCSDEKPQIVIVEAINKNWRKSNDLMYGIKLSNGNCYWVTEDSLSPLPNYEDSPEFMEAYPEVES